MSLFVTCYARIHGSRGAPVRLASQFSVPLLADPYCPKGMVYQLPKSLVRFLDARNYDPTGGIHPSLKGPSEMDRLMFMDGAPPDLLNALAARHAIKSAMPNRRGVITGIES